MKPWRKKWQTALYKLLKMYETKHVRYQHQRCYLCACRNVNTPSGCKECPWIIMENTMCIDSASCELSRAIRHKESSVLKDPQYEPIRKDRIRQIKEWIEFYEKSK